MAIDQKTLDRIDRVAGPQGRQRFIREAILAHLEREIPPRLLELEERMSELERRITYLETLHGSKAYLSGLSEVVTRDICRDDLERNILAYFIRHEGATTPELARALLGDSGKRRTILSRLEGINRRAEELLGVPLFVLKKGIVRGKRGAWWLTNIDAITQ